MLQSAADSLGLSLSAYCSNTLLEQSSDEEGAYFNRGNRLLSEDDLDDIAGRVALELNSIGEELSERIAGQIRNQPPVLAEALPDLPAGDPIELLDLPEQWEANLRTYVKAVAKKFEVAETWVLTVMLAKAYNSLSVSRSGFFSDAIGNWIEANEVEEAFLESKVGSDE